MRAFSSKDVIKQEDFDVLGEQSSSVIHQYAEYILHALHHTQTELFQNHDMDYERLYQHYLNARQELWMTRSFVDGMKGAISRRDFALNEQRKMYYKEVIRLREQLTVKGTLEEKYDMDQTTLFNPEAWLKDLIGDDFSDDDSIEAIQKKAQAAVDRLNEQFEKDKFKLQKQMNQLSVERDRQLEILKAEVQRQIDEASSRQKQLETLEEESAAANSNLDQLSAQFQMRIEDQLASHRQMMQDFEQKMITQQSEMDQMIARATETQTHEFEEEKERLLMELQETRVKVEEKQDKIFELEGVIEDLKIKTEMTAKRGKVEEESKTNELLEKLTRLQLEKEMVQNECTQLKSKITKIETALGEDEIKAITQQPTKGSKSKGGVKERQFKSEQERIVEQEQETKTNLRSLKMAVSTANTAGKERYELNWMILTSRLLEQQRQERMEAVHAFAEKKEKGEINDEDFDDFWDEMRGEGGRVGQAREKNKAGRKRGGKRSEDNNGHDDNDDEERGGTGRRHVKSADGTLNASKRSVSRQSPSGVQKPVSSLSHRSPGRSSPTKTPKPLSKRVLNYLELLKEREEQRVAKLNLSKNEIEMERRKNLELVLKAANRLVDGIDSMGGVDSFPLFGRTFEKVHSSTVTGREFTIRRPEDDLAAYLGNSIPLTLDDTQEGMVKLDMERLRHFPPDPQNLPFHSAMSVRTAKREWRIEKEREVQTMRERTVRERQMRINTTQLELPVQTQMGRKNAQTSPRRFDTTVNPSSVNDDDPLLATFTSFGLKTPEPHSLNTVDLNETLPNTTRRDDQLNATGQFPTRPEWTPSVKMKEKHAVRDEKEDTRISQQSTVSEVFTPIQSERRANKQPDSKQRKDEKEVKLRVYDFNTIEGSMSERDLNRMKERRKEEKRKREEMEDFERRAEEWRLKQEADTSFSSPSKSTPQPHTPFFPFLLNIPHSAAEETGRRGQDSAHPLQMVFEAEGDFEVVPGGEQRKAEKGKERRKEWKAKEEKRSLDTTREVKERRPPQAVPFSELLPKARSENRSNGSVLVAVEREACGEGKGGRARKEEECGTVWVGHDELAWTLRIAKLGERDAAGTNEVS
ncbi:hypothetical protein BLNAU_21002 [Blattamonas nauphoetae]|uniref:Uncharacterized protein n=1 Tax=Blattamonas nauphoetae TaxID=2049346 RepID=A0ABQ9WX75_9EUKA|nr:hypothetical protein BLNAU_21002 [Blattamonas nauphoetae]